MRSTHLEAGQTSNHQLLKVCGVMHPPIYCFSQKETEKNEENQHRRPSNNQEIRQHLQYDAFKPECLDLNLDFTIP